MGPRPPRFPILTDETLRRILYRQFAGKAQVLLKKHGKIVTLDRRVGFRTMDRSDLSVDFNPRRRSRVTLFAP
jgi:hypothetical protein